MQEELLTIQEYAARAGKAERTVRQKCQLGHLPGAIKIGRDWLIPADAPYVDNRVNTGLYKGGRKKKVVQE